MNLMLVLPEERPGLLPHDDQLERSGVASPAPALNPLAVAGWDRLVAGFDAATPFHTSGWLRVLHETYGHTPLYLCQFSGPQLTGCLPLAEVRSPFTGRRGVTLPFTDECLALMTSPAIAPALWAGALAAGRARNWKYLECRSAGIIPVAGATSLEFYGHSLDLRPGETALFAQLDSAVRRALRKAQASELRIELSDQPAAVEQYYRLHCLTRRRQGVPPQPWRFFENLGRHLIAKGQGMVITARQRERPVAAGIFLHFGECAIYKFGASDESAQHMRPNNLVLWEAIRYYAVREYGKFDFGRTSLANEGLRRFKRSFGALERRLVYYRHEFRPTASFKRVEYENSVFPRVVRRLPLPLLRLAGRLLYPCLS